MKCPTCRLDHPGRACFYDRLRAALGDLQPSPREERILRWLAGLDEPTVEPIAELFERLRGVGPTR